MRPAAKGWIGLALYVILWDLFAPETLSTGCADLVRHRRHRWLVIPAWAVLSAHLLTLLPDRYDPLKRLGAIRKVTRP